MNKKSLVFVFLGMIIGGSIFIGSQSTNVHSITISGILIDQITGEPVEGAKLLANPKVITDSQGNFKFNLINGFERRTGWHFEKYGYLGHKAPIQLARNSPYPLSLSIAVFDGGWIYKDISDLTEINIGNLEIYPSIRVSTFSDFPAGASVSYRLKNTNLSRYNTGGQPSLSSPHDFYHIPLDYDIFVTFEDVGEKKFNSTTYHIPLDARGKVVNLEYSNGESNWFISEDQITDSQTQSIKEKKSKWWIWLIVILVAIGVYFLISGRRRNSIISRVA